MNKSIRLLLVKVLFNAINELFVVICMNSISKDPANFWVTVEFTNITFLETSPTLYGKILIFYLLFSQFSSVAQSYPTLCDPMNHSTLGLPVHHQLPEFTQTHVH